MSSDSLAPRCSTYSGSPSSRGGRERAGARQVLMEGVVLVGQADADERAADALRAVEQGLGQSAGRDDAARLGERLERLSDQRIGEDDPDAAPRAREVQGALGGRVAVGAQQQPLGADLDALGVVGAFGDIGRCRPTRR